MAKSLEHIEIIGMDCHIGSQLTEVVPFSDAPRSPAGSGGHSGKGYRHTTSGSGRGPGVRYRNEVPPEPSTYVDQVRARMGDRALTLSDGARAQHSGQCGGIAHPRNT